MVENQLHQTFKQNANWTTAGNDWNMYTSPNTNSKSTSKMMLGRAFFSFAYWDLASFHVFFSVKFQEEQLLDQSQGMPLGSNVIYRSDFCGVSSPVFFAGRFVPSFPYLNVSCMSWLIHIWMFPKIGGKPPKSSILIGFSIMNHPFWGTNIFGNTLIWKRQCIKVSRLSWSQGVKWRATSKVTSQASYWMRVYKGNRHHLVTTVSLG